jgi:hypothetical protein
MRETHGSSIMRLDDDDDVGEYDDDLDDDELDDEDGEDDDEEEEGWQVGASKRTGGSTLSVGSRLGAEQQILAAS